MFQINNSTILYTIFLQIKQRVRMVHQFKIAKPFYYPNRKSAIESEGFNKITVYQKAKSVPPHYYYKLLGLMSNASPQQIKAAYYKLAKKFHPDASLPPQAATKFQEISNAYNILNNDLKRQQYDQLGYAIDETNTTKSIAGKEAIVHRKITKNPLIKVQKIRPTKNEILKIVTSEFDLPVTFLQAIRGTSKQIDVKYYRKCISCNGLPTNLSKQTLESCRECGGSGKEKFQRGSYNSYVVCSFCDGKRYMSRKQCKRCENRGFILEKITVPVRIPPNSKTGDVIYVTNPINNQKMNVHVKVLENDYFQRDGNDIHTVKFITISQAILGGKFKIRGIHEEFDLEVQPGVESHSIIKVPNKGIRSSFGVGNHVVTLKIKIPRNLTTKQRQLVLALSRTEDPIFDKIAN